jgi:hypothetical protein
LINPDQPEEKGGPMRPSGSMRAQIGTLILATSGIQIANSFFPP